MLHKFKDNIWFHYRCKSICGVFKYSVFQNFLRVETIDNADHYYSPRHTTTFRLRYFADYLGKHRILFWKKINFEYDFAELLKTVVGFKFKQTLEISSHIC
jgi:hypothetical protein